MTGGAGVPWVMTRLAKDTFLTSLGDSCLYTAWVDGEVRNARERTPFDSRPILSLEEDRST